jgi:hypothetical protein
MVVMKPDSRRRYEEHKYGFIYLKPFNPFIIFFKDKSISELPIVQAKRERKTGLARGKT